MHMQRRPPAASCLLACQWHYPDPQHIRTLKQQSLVPMTHTPETGAENRLHFFPALVSGTCVMQIWDRIRLVPETGAE